MGDIGVGVGVWTPSPRGRAGPCGITAHNLALEIFPKKLTFLRLNDLVNFHNFIFPPKKWPFLRLSIFLRFLSNFIPKKNDVFLYPPLLASKRQAEKIFPENFQILFTLLKNNFQFYFFLFYKWKPPKNFSRKLSKILKSLIEMRGQKITGKNWKLYSF